MSARDSHNGQAPDYTRRAQAFRKFDGTPVEPPRVTTPDQKAVGIGVWRSSPFVSRELDRASRIGFLWGAFIATLCAIGAFEVFHFLGVH